MPRSHSEHAYPSIYWRMIESFGRTSLPFHVTCSSKAEAYNRRNEWNSFIRALERNAHKNPRYNDLVQIARSRRCEVRGPQENILNWVPRDFENFTQTLEDQLEEFNHEIEEQDASEKALIEFHPSLIPEPPAETPLESQLDSAIHDFLATPDEDSHAEGLFDDLLEESELAADQAIQEQEQLGLLVRPLKPMSTSRTFSSEDEDPTTV